jgi:hypothetical protein
VSRAKPVQTAARNFIGDEGRSFGFGDQVAGPKPPRAALVKRLQPAHLKALDKWIDQQKEPYTRPEAIRGMIETMLHILSKDQGEKPAKKAMK